MEGHVVVKLPPVQPPLHARKLARNPLGHHVRPHIVDHLLDQSNGFGSLNRCRALPFRFQFLSSSGRNRERFPKGQQLAVLCVRKLVQQQQDTSMRTDNEERKDSFLSEFAPVGLPEGSLWVAPAARQRPWVQERSWLRVTADWDPVRPNPHEGLVVVPHPSRGTQSVMCTWCGQHRSLAELRDCCEFFAQTS